MRTSLKKSSGFTMIEVIAVLMIFGVVAAVVVSYAPSTDSYKLASEEATMKGHLRYAQFRAMGDKVSWGISFTANSYTLQKNGAPASYNLPNENSAAHNLQAGVSITAGVGTTVSFDEWGSPGLFDILITLSVGADSRTVTVTRNTGFIQ